MYLVQPESPFYSSGFLYPHYPFLPFICKASKTSEAFTSRMHSVTNESVFFRLALECAAFEKKRLHFQKGLYIVGFVSAIEILKGLS